MSRYQSVLKHRRGKQGTRLKCSIFPLSQLFIETHSSFSRASSERVVTASLLTHLSDDEYKSVTAIESNCYSVRVTVTLCKLHDPINSRQRNNRDERMDSEKQIENCDSM